MERKKTLCGDINTLQFIGRLLLDAFLRYGFSPHRPIVYLLIWAAVSTVIFERAYLKGEITPIQNSEKANVEPRFNSILFSIDSLVPIVDFNQKKTWNLNMPRRQLDDMGHSKLSSWAKRLRGELPSTLATWLVVFNTFFGWAMTTLFAASVTGLIRGAKDY